jgi:glyoxylase-like metal-dependent hydrolase (beta-lactamase superfamily II)
VRVHQIQTGGDRNFAYVVADDATGAAIVIDPSYTPDRVVAAAKAEGLTIDRAFCTHDHHDHTNGNAEFERLTGVRPLLFGDVDPETGQTVAGGATFPLGDLTIEILHTPGHTTDSICLHIGDAVFTGDTLFVGKVGGTDLGDAARTEYESLHNTLLALPDATRVFPGHDVGVAPESTIGHERETNPFLLRPDVEAFIDLKRNWAAYKEEHGIA